MPLYFITALLLLIPSVANATVFLWDQEMGAIAPSEYLDGQPFSDDCTNLPSADSSVVFGSSENHFSMVYDVGAGASSEMCLKVGYPFAGEDIVCAMTRIYVNRLPDARRTIFRFADSSDNAAGMLTLETDGSFRTYYRDYNRECTTSNNNATECSCALDANCPAECDEANAGESKCSDSHFGETAAVTTDTWYFVGLEQDNTAGNGGNVQMSLFYGLPGAVIPITTRLKPQGVCAIGGTPDTINGVAYACDETADCNGGTCDGGACTCDTTGDVISVDSIAIGTDDNDGTTTGPKYYLDDIYISNTGCERLNYFLVDKYPDNVGAEDDWTAAGGTCANHANCVDDTESGSPPAIGAVGLVNGTVQSFTTTDWTFVDTCTANVCTLSGVACSGASDCMSTSPPVPAVATYAWMRDQATGNDATTASVSSGFRVASNTDSASPYQVLDFTSTSFHYGSYHAREQSPANAAWETTDLTSLETLWTYSAGTCLSNCDARIDVVAVTAMFGMPDPATPGILRDRVGNDALVTVGIIGDSRINGPVESGEFDDLADANNILDCARGGATVGDIEDNLANIKAGSSSGYLGCEPRKGAPDHDLDAAVIDIGINSLRGMTLAAPSTLILCTTNDDCYGGSACNTDANCSGFLCTGGTGFCNSNADCHYCQGPPQGYCMDDGGGNQGDPCWCPKNDWWLSDESSAATDRYCTNTGAFLDTCINNPDCACATNADCPGACYTGKTCSTTCSGDGRLCSTNDDCNNYCAVGGGAGTTCAVNHSSPTSNCASGCLGSPECPNGLCVASNSLAEIERAYTAVIDSMAADGIAVILVLDPETEPMIDPFTESAQASGCWRWYNAGIGALNAYLRDQYIEDATGNVFIVDANSYMRECCDGDIVNCLKSSPALDGAHYDGTGEACLGAIINDCLTNGAANNAPSDGTCTSGVCTAGKVGDTCTACDSGPRAGYICSTNADCTSCLTGYDEGQLCETNADCDGNCGTAETCTDDDTLCDYYECTFVDSVPTALPDLTDYMWGFYDCESAAGATETDQSAGGSTSDDLLQTGGTVGRDTSNFVEGAQACDFDDVSNPTDVLECTGACTDSDFVGCSDSGTSSSSCPGGGHWAMGAWIRPENTSGSNRLPFAKFTSNLGYELKYAANSNQFKYRMGGGSNQVTTITDPGSSPIGSFYHVVGVWNGNLSGSEIGLFVDGQNVAVGDRNNWGNTTHNLTLGHKSTNTDFDGQIDEAWFIHSESPMGLTMVNKIMDCGVRGEMCACSSTDPTAYEICSTNSDCRYTGNTTALCRTDITPNRCMGRGFAAEGDVADCDATP